MIRCGILAIGNTGSVIGALANNNNIPVLGINSSMMDIDAIKSKTKINIICIGDSFGAGMNRNKAKEYIKANMKSLIGTKEFTEFMDSVDVVFVVNSTSGGTGSGASLVITDVLSHYYSEDKMIKEGLTPKYFINIGILPSLDESVGAQRNTIEYLREMIDLKLSYLLFDNNNSKSKSTDETFSMVNKAVVDVIRIFRGEFTKISQYGMIDEADLLRIILTPGMIFVNKLDNILEENIKTDQSLEDMLLNNINTNNLMVNLDRDKIVKRRGIIANISENLRPYYDKDLHKITEVFGEPIEQFNHFAINEDNDSRANYLILIMSGLSLPNNRLRMIIDRVSEAEAALAKTQENSLLDTAFEKIQAYSNKSTTTIKDTSDFDMDDIMSKY